MTPAKLSRTLYLNPEPDDEASLKILKALASKPRLEILRLQSDRLYNLSETAEALGLPISTTNMHIGILQEAGLLLTEHTPAARGTQKLCHRAFDTLVFQLPQHRNEPKEVLEVSMPIGAYVDCQVTPTCGLSSADDTIGIPDDPASFYDPARVTAQLLWFHSGFVEYRFPQRLNENMTPKMLTLSLELCSEAPSHHDNWPSDITVWINGTDIGAWRSPADFGGHRGRLTPLWWETHHTQYGLLKTWKVDGEGSTIDGLKVSNAQIADLALPSGAYITVRIGIKENARYVGGVNLFGAAFGNHPQDIVLSIHHT